MKATSVLVAGHPVFLLRVFLAASLLVTGRTNGQAQPGQKIALLIAIGNYPPEGGWQPIHAANDIAVISEALRKRGFPGENILLLQEAAATRVGILQIWNEVLLPQVKPGDVVYFQFSGHGQQVADDNGDELDGLDEAIVPYDSPQRFQPGVYQGKNLLRDDELNNLFTGLRDRLGPTGNLMVVLDACHSGTGTRAIGPARGTDVVMASDDFVQTIGQRPADNFARPKFSASEDRKRAPMVAFFGSAHNQLNWETSDEQGKLIGPLSYALSKILSQATSKTSYRAIFEQVRLEMTATAPKQQPQAEGTLDQEMLGGQLLERSLNYRVVRWNDPGSVVVDAGWVHGLNEGAVLGLYPAETRDPARVTALARGTVIAVQPFEATLQLDSSLRESVARPCWVYILEQNFGDLRIGLSVKLPDSHPVRTALLQKTARYPMIRTDEAPEVFVLAAGKNIQLIGTGEQVLEELGANIPAAEAADKILFRMLAYAQAKYMRKMEAKSTYLNVDFELIPVQIEEIDANTLVEKDTIPLASKRDALGNIHFQGGDWFRIRVHNRGSKAAYFTLLDIQPDNLVNPLIPGEGETPTQFRVGAGKTLDVPDKYFRIGPPAGVEMFKLIATEQPVDLRPIARSQGASTRANTQASALEQIFGQTFFNDDVMTRGGKTANLSAGSVHVHSVTFIIDSQK
ncbi:MAG: caspase family protein [Saprospirales bacterium]|nr:caspase family protein [Saprospirales bacterium]